MITFFVTDEAGNFVIQALLGVLAWIFDLGQEALERIQQETRTLNDICILHFNQRPAFRKWSELRVRHLPPRNPTRAAFHLYEPTEVWDRNGTNPPQPAPPEANRPRT